MEVVTLDDSDVLVVEYPQDPPVDPETGNLVRFEYTSLYKIDSTGNTRVWSVGYDPEAGGTGRIIVKSGVYGGAITTKTRPVVLNKSGRDQNQQALVFIRQAYKKKRVQKLYSETLESRVSIKEPMLAHTYMKVNRENGRVKRLRNGQISYSNKITEFPVWVSWKLDGMRMCAQRSTSTTGDLDKDVTLLSRGNNGIPYLEHIKEELLKFFDYLPSKTMIDGELYNHDMEFYDIIAACRTSKTRHPYNHRMEYWIFDICLPDLSVPYHERYTKIVNAFSAYFDEYGSEPQHLKLVTVEEVMSNEEILEKRAEYESVGYEGIMIRKPHGVYKFGRSSDLLKSKSFIDEEAVIIDMREETADPPGQAVLRVRDDTGAEFDLRPPGDVAERQKYLKDKKKFLNTKITFRYQERSPDGIPRFPVSVAIRDYE